MVSFLLASLVIKFLGVLLTCYALLEPPLNGGHYKTERQYNLTIGTTYFGSNNYNLVYLRRTGSNGSMSASGSAVPGFDTRRGIKFYIEIFKPRG